MIDEDLDAALDPMAVREGTSKAALSGGSSGRRFVLALMRSMKIKEALASDEDFTAAGFRERRA